MYLICFLHEVQCISIGNIDGVLLNLFLKRSLWKFTFCFTDALYIL